jgi:hypothetical protein
MVAMNDPFKSSCLELHPEARIFAAFSQNFPLVIFLCIDGAEFSLR